MAANVALHYLEVLQKVEAVRVEGDWVAAVFPGGWTVRVYGPYHFIAQSTISGEADVAHMNLEAIVTYDPQVFFNALTLYVMTRE